MNVTILLENDIDMSGVEWKPIYTSGEPTYTVDGQGHTLRNFSLNGKFGAVYEYQIWGITLGKYNAYTGVWGKFEGVMKNLTFENITINGLADDEVHTDVDGNPIDHSKEYAYFAGCVTLGDIPGTVIVPLLNLKMYMQSIGILKPLRV